MKRITAVLLAAAVAALLAACEPSRENIVDTAAPMATEDAVKEAPGVGADTPPAETGAPGIATSGTTGTDVAAPTATETATETAAQPATRTQ